MDRDFFRGSEEKNPIFMGIHRLSIKVMPGYDLLASLYRSIRRIAGADFSRLSGQRQPPLPDSASNIPTRLMPGFHFPIDRARGWAARGNRVRITIRHYPDGDRELATRINLARQAPPAPNMFHLIEPSLVRFSIYRLIAVWHRIRKPAHPGERIYGNIANAADAWGQR